jgi:hypothetical protein
MKIITFSKVLEMTEKYTNENINLIYQFYISNNQQRYKEIIKCLEFNVLNKFITKIYLLNERIYTMNELGIGIDSDKIIQYDIQKRLTFKDFFKFMNEHDINGYNILINSDIFLDDSINNLNYSDLSKNKKMMALLRYEYNNKDISKSKLFGPRFDSQDTWIIHSNYKIDNMYHKIFNFELGKPRCDNKMIYLMNILGYQVINDPYKIKTYHYHRENDRQYTITDKIQDPLGILIPYNTNITDYIPCLDIDLKYISRLTNNFKELQYTDNEKLYNYIKDKFNNGEIFIIPQIGEIENNYVFYGFIMYNKKKHVLNEYISSTKMLLYKNHGIVLYHPNTIIEYSLQYIESFINCEMYSAFEPQTDIYKTYNKSHDFIRNMFKKKVISNGVFEIFHYIHNVPWTLSLKNKKILIISNNNDKINMNINLQKNIYGIDLFPNCFIITLLAPFQTNDNNEFNIEFNIFIDKLNDIPDFDIALVSAGAFGNLICNYIYKQLKKSSINVGNVLQMYFGISNTKWIKMRPDIFRLYLNSYWINER